MKEINYYGVEDNYIHLKFGDCVKMYNFTDDFIAKYPKFSEEYGKYWEGRPSRFKNAFQVVSYVFDQEIPVHFYYNFTDKPASGKKEIIEYLLRENTNYQDRIYKLD